MFIEQSAPPQPAAHVQIQPDKMVAPQPAPSSAPSQPGVAAPESIPVQPSNSAPAAPASAQASSVAPEPVPTPSRAGDTPANLPAPTKSSGTPGEAAKVQRKQEIEQALIKLTNQAKAKRKEQEQQQAATDAAKYLEAGEVDQAQQATQKLTLPEDVKAKLQKRIAEAQAKKGKKTLAKGSKPGQPKVGDEESGPEAGAIAPGSATLSGRYSTQPILPSMPIGLPFPFSKLMGKGHFNLSFPLGLMAPVTSAFGWRIHPIDGTPRFHRGIDFGAPYGSPVVAAMGGVVEAAGYIDGYGLTVVLRHNNQQTLYAHLSEVFVEAGDRLKQGQVLGQVGSTGNSTGPHLHFEVHQLTDQGWVALDPAAVMNQAIAIGQKLPAKPISFKGQIVNLSASGVLDLNAPSSTLSNFGGGSTLLSSLLPTVPEPQPAVRIPFTMLSPVIPEVGWLISPLVENLLADQAAYFSLPDLTDPSKAVSFQPLPSLDAKPIESVAANPWMTPPSQPPQVQLAASKPLSRLSIAETIPGAVNIANSRPPDPRRPRIAQPAAPLQVAQTFKPIQVTEQGLQSLKLDAARR